MKILALIKYSLDVSEIKVDAATSALRLNGVPERIGNIDKHVVEAAVRLKEAVGGSVNALSFGPAAAREAFREVLAMGVDGVTLVEDPCGGQGSAKAIVRVLETAIRKLGPVDLVLCGFASDDGYSHQVGPRLAERLGLPLISYVRRIDLEGGLLTAERDLEDRVQAVRASLPVLVTIAEEAYPPRRTTLMDALKAKKKPVEVWDAETDLGFSRAAFEQAQDVTTMSLAGIRVPRKQHVLKGQDMGILADCFIDALLSESLLKEGE